MSRSLGVGFGLPTFFSREATTRDSLGRKSQEKRRKTNGVAKRRQDVRYWNKGQPLPPLRGSSCSWRQKPGTCVPGYHIPPLRGSQDVGKPKGVTGGQQPRKTAPMDDTPAPFRNELQTPGYVRYADDLVLFADSKSWLWDAHDALRARLAAVTIRQSIKAWLAHASQANSAGIKNDIWKRLRFQKRHGNRQQAAVSRFMPEQRGD